MFHSAEVGPANENNESQLSILTVSPGESHAHCNKYAYDSYLRRYFRMLTFFLPVRFLRLKIDEDANGLAVLSSNGRHCVMERLGTPKTVGDVIGVLSNSDDQDYPIYRRGTEKDVVVTIATGIFDFKSKEWKMYVDSAKTTHPIAVFPLDI